MKQRFLRRATVCAAGLALVLSASGCRQLECGQYEAFVDDTPQHRELLQWADATIFATPLAARDLVPSFLAGPGSYRIRSLAEKPLQLPPALANFRHWLGGGPPEVQLMGEDKTLPAAIFIGKKSYRGVVVARADIGAAVGADKPGGKENIWKMRDRVAIICYRE